SDARCSSSLLRRFSVTTRPLPKRARRDRGFCRQEKENHVACARLPTSIKAVPTPARNHCLRITRAGVVATVSTANVYAVSAISNPTSFFEKCFDKICGSRNEVLI